MSSENYSHSLLEAISGQLPEQGGNVVVKALNQRSLVKDASLKFIVLDNSSHGLAFILMSNDDYPEEVRLAVEAANKARAIVGDGLSDFIVIPFYQGYIGKKSFAVFPCLVDLRSGRMARVLARQHLVNQVCVWLEYVAVKTTVIIPADSLQVVVGTPLEWVNTCTWLSDELRADALTALNALERLDWQPRQVFSHNDLWSGNVLIQPAFNRTLASFGMGQPRVIDWLSSAQEGVPAFDLINYAHSSGLSLNKTADYLRQVQTKTNSAYVSGYFDLLSGFGRLGMNRGEFSLERFAMLFKEIAYRYKQLQTFLGY